MGDDDEQVKRSWIIENSWTCRSCQTENQGRDMVCRQCGASRDKRQQDVAADAESAVAISDERLVAQAEAGANWVCTYCNTQQRGLQARCENCGGERERGTTLQTEEPASSLGEDAPIRSSRGTWIGLTALVLLVAGVGAWLFVPRELKAVVRRTSWTHTVNLERKTLEHRSGWDVPRDALHVKCERRTNGSERCHPHTCGTETESYACGTYDCNCHKRTTKLQNGYSRVEEVCSTCTKQCERDVPKTCYDECPVYRDWCSYDEYVWPIIATKQAKGEGATTTWPELTSDAEDERIGKVEEYEVEFERDGKRFRWKPPTFAQYGQFKQGTEWVIKVTSKGEVTSVAH